MTYRCSGCALSAPAYWLATTCALKVRAASNPLNDPTVVRYCDAGRMASRVTGRLPPGKNGSPLSVGVWSLQAAAGSRASRPSRARARTVRKGIRCSDLGSVCPALAVHPRQAGAQSGQDLVADGAHPGRHLVQLDLGLAV